jgi:Cu(I)/Ag(I) efflux system periplasmic protein CusF
MKLFKLIVTTLFSAAFTTMTVAQTDAPKSKITAPMARATVVAVDMQSKRVLLKHGPIPSLHMGPMTMEFAVQDTKLLKQLKKGSKLRFTAVQEADDYVITRLRVVR